MGGLNVILFAFAKEVAMESQHHINPHMAPLDTVVAVVNVIEIGMGSLSIISCHSLLNVMQLLLLCKGNSNGGVSASY